MKKTEMINKNLDLHYHLMMQLFDDPDSLDIPDGADIIMLPEDDPPLREANLRLGKKREKAGATVVYVNVRLVPETRDRAHARTDGGVTGGVVAVGTNEIQRNTCPPLEDHRPAGIGLMRGQGEANKQEAGRAVSAPFIDTARAYNAVICPSGSAEGVQHVALFGFVCHCLSVGHCIHC